MTLDILTIACGYVAGRALWHLLEVVVLLLIKTAADSIIDTEDTRTDANASS